MYLVLASSTTFSPTSTAKPAKFALARCTSHVVAAFSQFDHLIALGTTLECTVVESTQDKLSCLVSLARAAMGERKAEPASLGKAGRACDILFGVSIKSQW